MSWRLFLYLFGPLCNILIAVAGAFLVAALTNIGAFDACVLLCTACIVVPVHQLMMKYYDRCGDEEEQQR